MAFLKDPSAKIVSNSFSIKRVIFAVFILFPFLMLVLYFTVIYPIQNLISGIATPPDMALIPITGERRDLAIPTTSPPDVIILDPKPILYKVTPQKARIGSLIEIEGHNLSGFEGDLEAWIVNEEGEEGLLVGDSDISTPDSIKLILEKSICNHNTGYSGIPCESKDIFIMTPGKYKIYVQTWDNISNQLDFEIE